MERSNLDLYPEELHDAILKYTFTDTYEIIEKLIEWIESNVSEEV